ncbi:MAG TPA: pyridoxamine 5'-phosphate oxidase family protein [Acidimicrobiales bacterium]|nr:pyridoxamine 5'-phosphate oxidase family protein [Acidimicrobiales bacterium]
MSKLRLSDEEVWRFLEQSRVGIFTSLRRNGAPVSLPVWFVPLDGRIYLHGPKRGKKFSRVRNDPRVSFLCESGERWIELKAVHLSGRATVVENQPDLEERVNAEFGRRYSSLRPQESGVPRETLDHYAGFATIEIVPDAEPLSWDNSRLAVRT